MFPLLMPMLIGGGLGALTNKDPLKGAALGAGLGAAGGALAPGLLGAAAPAGGAMGGTGLTAGAGTGLNLASAGGGLGMQAPSGLLSGGGGLGLQATTANLPAAPMGLMDQFKTAAEAAAPFGQAASAAMSINGLLNQPEQPITPNPTIQNVGGAETLSALAGQNQQSIDQQMQLAAQQRQARRNLYRGGI